MELARKGKGWMDGRSKDMGWISQILTGLTFIAKTAVVARSRRMVVTVDSHSGCPVHTDSVTAHFPYLNRLHRIEILSNLYIYVGSSVIV
jgi:quinolinate synthase